MKRLLRIARTEALEQRRQPWMLFILAFNYVLWSGFFIFVFVLIDVSADNPALIDPFKQRLEAGGVAFDAFLRAAATSFATVSFTNLPAFVAISACVSVLHDRESGTLPFLMLAPITRFQLLLGKLAGAVALPLVLHVIFVGASSAVLARLPTLAPDVDKFGGSPAWWVAYLLGAPASAALLGSIGTVISALARDPRSSTQFVNFLLGLSSLVIGAVLIGALPRGATVQLLFAAGCLAGALLILLFGARLVSKDITA